jgi:DNA-binding LacI/PurR family transcriptional regulator
LKKPGGSLAAASQLGKNTVYFSREVPPMATQLDVAENANVSYMTVSRVVNNNPNVKKETRERVLKAIKDLSYFPNSAARVLAGGKTNNVGIVFPKDEYVLTRQYFIELAIKIEQALSEQGYHLILGAGQADLGYGDLHQLVKERKMDGLIVVAPPTADQRLRVLLERKIPFVLIHGESDDPACSVIDTDSSLGTTLAMRHLVGLGHTRIGFVTGKPLEINARDRLNAYVQFCHAENLPDDDLVCPGDWSLESGYEAFQRLASHSRRPTAILFSNDQMALGAIKAAHDRAIAIPRDISLVGFDDMKYSSFVTPGLTTVRMPIDKLARLAVDNILANILCEPKHQKIILPPQLIVRESTGLPAR